MRLASDAYDFRRMLLSVATLLSLLASVTGAQKPADPTPPAAGGDANVARLLDYLEAEHAKKATAPYWVTRGMAVISLARSPRPTATAKLFDYAEKDKHDVVRVLAWQAILARAGELDAKAQTRFQTVTWMLAERDAIRGSLRLPLLKVMAATVPTDRTRRIWQKIFSETNAWESQDIPVLDALGDCLKTWRSRSLAAALIDLLGNKDHCVRAEYVLQRAGCDAQTARGLLGPEVLQGQNPKRNHPSSKDLWQSVRGGAEQWLVKNQSAWVEPKTADPAAWKALAAAYVAAPVALDQINPDDKTWHGDLELGKADISEFDIVFVVDATGSMGDVLDWLRHDVARVAAAAQLVAKEQVGVGITFYRDKDGPWVVKHLGLTARLPDLEPELLKITADGGGDIPEAVLEGLTDALNNNPWKRKAGNKPGSKFLVLIGDAPPHAQTVQACVDLAGKAAAAGMRVHAAKVTTELGRNDLSTFDDIAKAGGGSTVAVEFQRPLRFMMVDAQGKPMDLKPIERPEVQTLVAVAQSGEMPGEVILTRVLTDALVTPAYRDRAEPLARTLLAYTDPRSPPEKRMNFPVNTPPLGVGNLNAQGNPNQMKK